MQLKDSETNLEQILIERKPDNIEVPAEEAEAPQPASVEIMELPESQSNNNDVSLINNNLKKVTNIENEQINKQHSEHKHQDGSVTPVNDTGVEALHASDNIVATDSPKKEVVKNDDDQLNHILRKNILSCVEKVAQIQQLKKAKDELKPDEQVLILMCERCALLVI